MSDGYLIALLFGVLGSVVVHLSQGLMRLGILRQQQAILSRNSRLLYLTGMLLNFSAPLWVVIANRFGSTILYTSIYAIGLLALLWFSCIKLGMTLRRRDLAGAVLLTVGAALLALGSITLDAQPMHELNTMPMWWFAMTLLLIVLPLALLTRRYAWLPQGILFGALGGAFLALDSVFKGIAQSDLGAAAWLPSTAAGMQLFAISFIGAIMAFAMTQWAHIRAAPPSATIAGYDAAYVLTPLLLLSLATGDASVLNALCLWGAACILVALVLLHRAPTR